MQPKRPVLWGLLCTLFVGLWLWSSPPAVAAAPAQSEAPVIIYFFWGDGCPHCNTAKPFLADLAKQYPNVVVRDYEVWHVEANREPFIRMTAKFGFEPTAVPTIFIGDRYWIGYAEVPYAQEIEATVAACAATGCPDAGAGVMEPLPTPTAAPTATPAPVAAVPARAAPIVAAPVAAALTAAAPAEASGATVLPWIGAIDLASQPLAISTALIAFVDGFNPCSVWVLTMLLALTLHTGSRKKVFIVGLVFLTVTALVYALFIAGLFTMFTILPFTGWIQVIVALVALFFALVNIKDYFWYKEGISFTIADEQKPGIYRRMRHVMNAGDSLPALIGATVVMAAGVSLVEFSCTAGFPVLWTNLLASQEVTATGFLLLLLLYMAIYQLDEIVIFGAAVFSLRATRLEEKQGRILKLVSGMLMLSLAMVMLINPNMMNDLGMVLWVFLFAFGGAALVLLVHRVILPRFGIYIGTELTPPQSAKRRNSERA
jgi:cytochrome c biogenesis protein CcdA/thiol-disulfide isomerase/thioredoxin